MHPCTALIWVFTWLDYVIITMGTGKNMVGWIVGGRSTVSRICYSWDIGYVALHGMWLPIEGSLVCRKLLIINRV